MTDRAAARMGTATEPMRRAQMYDEKCQEWDGYYFLGDSPQSIAYRHPGQWQLVYDLRPLELVPYWLGIPFRPYHPVYAVIYDAQNPGYYTAPAAKIAELGRPRYVYGMVPFARLWSLLGRVDPILYALSDRIRRGLALGLRTLGRVSDAVSVVLTARSGVGP